MQMKTMLVAAAAALALSGGSALAAGAIANSTTTSMGAPTGSPGYSAGRSEVVPGLPPQTKEAQTDSEQKAGRQAKRAPTNPVTGDTQVTR